MNDAMEKLIFPKDFLWGAAGSSYQTEGGNRNADWWAWEHSQKREMALEAKGLDPRGFCSGEASDFYNRYDEDFGLAQQLNHNATRFGIEWSRVEPKEGKFDEAVLDHYEKMLQSAKFHGLTVFLTLHHYTNPIWFAKTGGFGKRENIGYFLRYAKKIVARFSQYADFWITINEPELYVMQGYVVATFPPQKKNPFLALRVVNNLIKAHNQISQYIKENYPAPVSMAFNQVDLEPSGFLGEFAVRVLRYFTNSYILLRTISYCDYIGVNYYFHHHLGILGFRKHSAHKHELTDRGWGIHPEGIEPVLMSLKNFNKPIYILENGIADAKDTRREKYIKDHLYYVHKAISQGADVRGYLYWSLTDNFEWEEGHGPKFGLIEIDREDLLRRKVRFSALKYAEVCKNNYLEINI
jgi:beta-glucosidase